jgi:RNA polymerase sigma-70 factor (ECF subfamily)
MDKPALNPTSWVASFGDYLFSYAVLKVGDRQSAEDLVQETFISAIKGKDSFKGHSSEKTWLVTILKNKITDYYRKKDVLRNATEYIAGTEDDFTDHFFDPQDGHWRNDATPGYWAESADSAIHTSEFGKVLQMCIHKMPPKLIPVFVARFIDEEDSDSICKVNGISPSNYWVMIHRAKVLMRSCLEKNWFLTRMAK